MILFPPCKINIGLDIVARRPDGFHDIDTVMVPVKGLCDSLEIVPNGDGDTQPEMSFSGLEVDCPPQSNIVVRAWELMHQRFHIGGIRAHLHKNIPFGAGLGGGSADAAYMLLGLNELFGLELPQHELADMALQLGSDVPFFLQNAPMRCEGRGEIMSPVKLPLDDAYIVVVKPDIYISTREAYAGVTPHVPQVALPERLAMPVGQWRGSVVNDFELTLFERYPRLAEIKQTLYDSGATYASMSGSGSALFGIFDSEPDFIAPADCTVWCGRLF